MHANVALKSQWQEKLNGIDSFSHIEQRKLRVWMKEMCNLIKTHKSATTAIN